MSPALSPSRIPASREAAPDHPLPFPFLTLCWTIGLKGRWVRIPERTDDPLAMSLRADPLVPAGEPRRETRRRYRVGSNRLLARLAEAKLGPLLESSWIRSGSLSSFGSLGRCLERSALCAMSAERDPDRAKRAAAATLELLLAAPDSGHRTRSFPPLWRPLAAAVIQGTGAVYIPVPRPRYDPLAWMLLDRLVDQWESEGLTFLGRERRQLYLRAGTRRMARTYRVSRGRALACGRAAHRIWRHWYETRERRREASAREYPLPPALARTVGDAAPIYRAIRRGLRLGLPNPYARLLPEPLSRALAAEAESSIASFPRAGAGTEWPEDPTPLLARALGLSPMAATGRALGIREGQILKATRALATALIVLLAEPWSWENGLCHS